MIAISQLVSITCDQMSCNLEKYEIRVNLLS